jgi:hypothetical protein
VLQGEGREQGGRGEEGGRESDGVYRTTTLVVLRDRPKKGVMMMMMMVMTIMVMMNDVPVRCCLVGVGSGKRRAKEEGKKEEEGEGRSWTTRHLGPLIRSFSFSPSLPYLCNGVGASLYTQDTRPIRP